MSHGDADASGPETVGEALPLESARDRAKAVLSKFDLELPDGALDASVSANRDWWIALAQDAEVFLPKMPFQVGLEHRNACVMAHPAAAVLPPPIPCGWKEPKPPYDEETLEVLKQSPYVDVVLLNRRDYDPRKYYLWIQEFDPIFKHPEAVIGFEDGTRPFRHSDIVGILAVNAVQSGSQDVLPQRELLAIVMLHDGRFAYIFEYDDQGTDSDGAGDVWQYPPRTCGSARCITAPSLHVLIHSGLDRAARRHLGLAHIDGQSDLKLVQHPFCKAYKRERRRLAAGDLGQGDWRRQDIHRKAQKRCEEDCNFLRWDYSHVGKSLWNTLKDMKKRGLSDQFPELGQEDDDSGTTRILSLAQDGKEVTGRSLDGDEAFRIPVELPLLVCDLQSQIAKSLKTRNNLVQLLGADGSALGIDPHTGNPSDDMVSDCGSITVKHIERDVLEDFGEQVYHTWCGAHYLSQDDVTEEEFAKHFQESRCECEFHALLSQACDTAAAAAAAAATDKGKTKGPKLQRTTSMFSKARTGKQRFDWEQPAEITEIIEVITWCRAQLPRDKAEEKHEASKHEIQYDNPEGTVVLKKDKEEFFSPPSRAKGHKHHKQKKHDVHAIKHDVQTLKIFANLSLDVPATPDDCKVVIDKLKLRLEAHDNAEEQRAKKQSEYWQAKFAQFGNNDDVPRCNVWKWGPTYQYVPQEADRPGNDDE